MKKYELVNEKDGFYQVRALRDFGNVRKGDLGGYVENEDNLSHCYECWIYGNALVTESSLVVGNAQISMNSRIYGNARVDGNALVSGDAIVKQTKDIIVLGPIGDNRYITVMKSNRTISAGCFLGTFEDFKESVEKKYKGEGDYYFFFDAIEKYLNS